MTPRRFLLPFLVVLASCGAAPDVTVNPVALARAMSRPTGTVGFEVRT